ncbi:PulJ/GspJ family protein [Mucilaginibacter lacusdianchii]|uniref:PulJ/GspJ family protein n=1 Tax=Mucilaginibacter lacusdianchii TaxID=2684211 RepID=UPI00131D186F|nr:hypothetical protein [Mucilaginibacter sp. JXJ CY 39]
MTQNKHRLPAFTILELTIAMLISAVVVAITYTAYNMISGAYQGFTKKHNEMAVMIRLDELLRKDFFKAAHIAYRQDSLVLELSAQTVRYHFEPERVIRTSGIQDTFRVQIEKPKLFFEHGAVMSDGIDESNGNPVDELSLTVLYQTEKFPYHYLKLYSSENLFKPTAYAQH